MRLGKRERQALRERKANKRLIRKDKRGTGPVGKFASAWTVFFNKGRCVGKARSQPWEWHGRHKVRIARTQRRISV